MTGRRLHLGVLVAASTLLAVVAGAAQAQERLPPQVAAEIAQLELPVPTAPVQIDGATVLRVRGTASYPAEERAAAIAGRIRSLAADSAFQPESLRIEETAVSSQIMANRLVVIGVYDADGAIDGVSRQALANVYVGRIRSAIAAYRTGRSAAALRQAAISAFVATLVFFGLVVAVIWTRRKLDALLDSRYKLRIDALAAKSQEVVSVTRVWDFLKASLRYIRSAVIVVLAFVYLQYVFERFPHTRAASQRISGYVIGPLATMWASFVAWIPNLIFLVILAFVVRIVLRLMRRFFEAVEQGRIRLEHFDRDWATPTYKLLRPLVIAFALVVGYPYIPGSGSEAFKGVSLFLGIVFSLGSSSFIANMIAGYSMTYRRAFRLGDVVKIGDVMGVVTGVRLQVTHIRTIKNEEVVVPNSQILNTHVVNYSSLAHSKGLILHTTVGIGYETPWRQVEAMLLEAARRTPNLMTDPPPFVLQLQLGDFCVTYELNVYCADPLTMKATYTELHRHVLDVFNEYGVQIMTPAYEGDPAVPKVVPKEQWYLAPARPEPAPERGQIRL